MHVIFHVILVAFAHSEENRKENVFFLFKFNLCLHMIEKYRMLYSQKTKSKMAADMTDFLKSPILCNMGNKVHMIGLKLCVF